MRPTCDISLTQLASYVIKPYIQVLKDIPTTSVWQFFIWRAISLGDRGLPKRVSGAGVDIRATTEAGLWVTSTIVPKGAYLGGTREQSSLEQILNPKLAHTPTLTRKNPR